jgi:hypothetical protein
MPVIIPDKARRADLRFIHQHLFLYRETENPDALVKAVERMLKDRAFKRYIANNASLQRPIQSKDDMMAMAWAYVYSLLYARDYVAAALVLWGPKTFTPEPRAAQLMWGALFSKNLINVMGCGSVGKTFTPSAWCVLDWLLDPEWTRIEVASNSQDHVEKNLYADIVRLHTEAVLPLPGNVDSESISLDKKRGMGIFVLVIPGGPKSRGKLKGAKIKNRPSHPLFGDNSRLRILLDEAQEIPANIFDETPNLLSSVDDSVEHIKIMAAANPKDEWSRYGLNCKPLGGWDAISDEQEEWESETGWHVISINAMRTENVMAKKTIFPRMITYEGVQKIIRSQAGGNDQHPNVYTYVYGRFPKTGVQTTIINSNHLRRAEGDWIFDGPTIPIAGSDPAFTGDLPAMTIGRVGRAIGWVDYKGEKHELPEPAVKIQADGTMILPHGDTQDVADENMARCKQLNIKAENFGIDKTGTGRGVHDVIRRQWKDKVAPLAETDDGSAPIVGVEYAASPSEVKIADEDTQTPKELYDRTATELWMAGAKLFEYDIIRIGRGVDQKTSEELAGRRGGMKVGIGKKQSVEAKDAYKGRTGETSPDRADSFLIMLHVARMRVPSLVPRAKDTRDLPAAPRETGGWEGFDIAFGGSNMSGLDDDVQHVADLMKD